MTLEQISRLYIIFKTLQPEIKEWIASDAVTAAIEAIARRFVLSNEQSAQLPLLILRLVTQDLAPETLKAELAKEFSLAPDAAKTITEAIAKNIIAPIAPALRFNGIDTNLLGFNASATENPTAAIHESVTIEAADPTPKIQKKEEALKPFILHEEPRPRTESAPGPRSSFIFRPQAEDAHSAATNAANGIAPAHAIIERVVHYSRLRTPLNQAIIAKKPFI
jgi:hypothetical protein